MREIHVKGQCIYTRQPLYPVKVYLMFTSPENNVESDNIFETLYLPDSYVHSEVLDEDESGELTLIGHDFFIYKDIDAECDGFPTVIEKEYYFDAVPSQYDCLLFPLGDSENNASGQLSIPAQDFKTHYEPSCGRTAVFCFIKCQTDTLKEQFLSDCLDIGWRYA